MAIEGDQLSAVETKRRTQAALSSLLLSLLLLTVKFYAYRLTYSQAIFADAVESIVNVLAAAVALFVVVYAAKPADQDHPYGHGKSEYFSSAFEGGLIALAAVFIVIEAVNTLIEGSRLRELEQGLLLSAATGIANLLLGLFLVQRGKSFGSVALRASGQHVISDFWTSVGVVGGLMVVRWTGLVWLDSVMAMIVAGWLGYTGLKLVRDSASSLMDKEDLSILKELAIVFRQSMDEGIIQIHHVRVIRSGWYHHIDAHVVLPEFWDVTQVHQSINEFEKKVIGSYHFGGEMNFHVDPCRRRYCDVCNLVSCQIREKPFREKIPVLLEHLRSPNEPRT